MVKFQQIFNKFPTVEKYDFDQQFLSRTYWLNFSSNFTITVVIKKLKAWSFQLRKNYFCILNIERPVAHQSSITLFFIHPVLTTVTLPLRFSDYGISVYLGQIVGFIGNI